MISRFKVIDTTKQEDLLAYLEKDRLQTAHLVGEEILRKIKLPLKLIRGRSEKLFSELSFQQKQNVQGILDQVEQLEQMIVSFENFIQQESKQKSKFNLHDLCEDLLVFFQGRLHSSQIQVINTIPKQTLLFESESVLRQILMALLVNAIEALESSNQTDRTIFLHYYADNNTKNISVEDNGPGIPEPIANSIFHPFVSTKTHHVGLGLAICKKMTQDQAWELKLNSRKLEKGTCVSLKIPHSSSGSDSF